MTENKAGIKDTIKFAKEALDFAIEQTNEARYFNDCYPLFGLEKLSWIVSHLKPEKLKELICTYSSFNHGYHILDVTFPRVENQEDFHSTEFEVCLSDNPIQVLGWKDKDELVQRGVDEGMNRDWIEIGFERRAREKGIDLEWHFFSESRNAPNQNTTLNIPLIGDK